MVLSKRYLEFLEILIIRHFMGPRNTKIEENAQNLNFAGPYHGEKSNFLKIQNNVWKIP